METTVILNTNGTGLWSNKSKPVTVTGADCLITKDDDCLFGELMVGFDTASWSTDTDGLIYTDKLFLGQLRKFLMSQGFTAEAVDDISYSEQGMQGDEYVSLDAGNTFCKEWFEKYPETEICEY